MVVTAEHRTVVVSVRRTYRNRRFERALGSAQIAVLPAVARGSAGRRPAGGEWDRLRDPQRPAVEGRAGRLWVAQNVPQSLHQLEPARRPGDWPAAADV